MRRMSGLLVILTCGAAVAHSFADVPVRVVTYNILQGIAEDPVDRAADGNLLTSMDLDGAGPNTSLMPDIVCMQETKGEVALQAFRDEFLPGYVTIKGSITDGFISNGFYHRGDFTRLQYRQLSTPGPRPVLRLILNIPGASTPLVVYNAHFKAGGDDSDKATRQAEANAMANQVSSDFANGIDFDNNGVVDLFPTHYIFVGDLNHDDFQGPIIDALIIGGSNGLPTGLHDCRVETPAGAAAPAVWVGDSWSTRSGLSNRYDYILVSDAIYANFDADHSGSVSQDELNAVGFVYNSFDDAGAHASGQADATQAGSDHAPVCMTITLPSPPTIPGDVDGDGDVDLTDLSLMLASFGSQTGDANYNPDADVNNDGEVNIEDVSILLANFATGG